MILIIFFFLLILFNRLFWFSDYSYDFNRLKLDTVCDSILRFSDPLHPGLFLSTLAVLRSILDEYMCNWNSMHTSSHSTWLFVLSLKSPFTWMPSTVAVEILRTVLIKYAHSFRRKVDEKKPNKRSDKGANHVSISLLHWFYY
jgi:hypothetical protein